MLMWMGPPLELCSALFDDSDDKIDLNKHSKPVSMSFMLQPPNSSKHREVSKSGLVKLTAGGTKGA